MDKILEKLKEVEKELDSLIQERKDCMKHTSASKLGGFSKKDLGFIRKTWGLESIKYNVDTAISEIEILDKPSI